MNTIAFIFALLKAAGPLLSLLRALVQHAELARARGEGFDEAVAKGLEISHQGLQDAIAAMNAAEPDPEFEVKP